MREQASLLYSFKEHRRSEETYLADEDCPRRLRGTYFSLSISAFGAKINADLRNKHVSVRFGSRLQWQIFQLGARKRGNSGKSFRRFFVIDLYLVLKVYNNSLDQLV